MHFFRFGVLALALLSVPAQAIEPFVIKDIRVEGIQRTEPGTVFSYLPVKVGDTMTDDKAAQTIRALFATGFFRDVSLEAEDGVLVVLVQERPSIAQIEFTGLREFDKETVLKAMNQIGLGGAHLRTGCSPARAGIEAAYLSRDATRERQPRQLPRREKTGVVNFAVAEGDAPKSGRSASSATGVQRAGAPESDLCARKAG